MSIQPRSKIIPPPFTPGDYLGELYEHAERCNSRPAALLERSDMDVNEQWIKLYNKALRLLFHNGWAIDLPERFIRDIVDYARSDFSISLHLGGTTEPLELNPENMRISIPREFYHALQWALQCGLYDYEEKLNAGEKLYWQYFGLIPERKDLFTEPIRSTYQEQAKQYLDIDIRHPRFDRARKESQKKGPTR